jgi:hypothetical protein
MRHQAGWPGEQRERSGDGLGRAVLKKTLRWTESARSSRLREGQVPGEARTAASRRCPDRWHGGRSPRTLTMTLAAGRTMIQARASQAFQPARTVAEVKNAKVLALDFAVSSTFPNGVEYLVHSSAAEASIWFMP